MLKQEPQARRFYVSGSVQGVGFRLFAVGAAARAGLPGFVRNLRDGRVEVYAVGSEEQLGRMRCELDRGPRFAAVQNVLEEPAPIDSRYTEHFVIEHDD